VSTQELDVKMAWRAIRRGRRTVAAVAAAGMVAGLGFALIRPPLHTATSLVVLPPPPVNASQNSQGTQNIDTQVFIATSEPVLKSAGQNLNPPLDTDVVRARVAVSAPTADVIKFRARGTSAQQAMTLANAIAEVYLVFVTTDQKLPGDLGKKTGARMLEQATTSTGGNMLVHLAIYGFLGALLGGLAGSVIVLAIARGDRRLRLRDEIADAVGIPVLASVSSYRAKDISDWANLLEHYRPSAVDAWSLRKTLHRLGLDVKDGPPMSLGVISFAQDDKARPLGPQLAAFATSIGIPTALVIDTAPDPTPLEITDRLHEATGDVGVEKDEGAAAETTGQTAGDTATEPEQATENVSEKDSGEVSKLAARGNSRRRSRAPRNSKAAQRTVAKAEPRAEVKAEIKPDTKPDTKPEPEPAKAEPAKAEPAIPSQHRLLGDGTRFGDVPPEVALDIQLIVVDRNDPHLAGTLHTTTTIVALSAGAVTAEELARLAVAAAADDREIDGLVVTDPDPTDRTIGRVSQSMRRSSSRLPTLLTGTARRNK
jgi:capsular polysaccharide biosynthesis protein